MSELKFSKLPGKLGKWSIKKRLASRLDTIVLLGESEGELAAIKILKNADLLDDRDRMRFDQEVLNLKKLNHPSIPKIIDLDLVDAMQPWIATEYVSGSTIQERVSSGRYLKIEEWTRALKEITDALAYIHSLGIYHRDISPSNIILNDKGAKLIDFGLSYLEDSPTLTRTGLNVQGTPGTVSPESLTFKKNPKMDMFSLGSTFVFAGTGQFPFESDDDSVGNWMQSILYGPPNFHDLGKKQVQLLLPLLYKNSEERISSQAYREVLSEVSVQGSEISVSSSLFDSFLDKWERKSVGDGYQTSGRKFKRFSIRLLLFGTTGILFLLMLLSRYTRLSAIDYVLLFFLGVFPLFGIAMGFWTFFKGLGEKKWGRRKIWRSLSLSTAVFAAPYLATIVFFLGSMTPSSLENVLQGRFNESSDVSPSSSQVVVTSSESTRKPIVNLSPTSVTTPSPTTNVKKSSSVSPSPKLSPSASDKPLATSDKFKLSSSVASTVVVESIFGRPWKSGDMFWNIPLQATANSVIPDLTGIQFRPIGNTQGPWFEVPYKLKTSELDKTVYAQVDALLFAFLSPSQFCPEFRVVKEVSGQVTKIWEKSLPECATDYNP
jgi:serine/threonine protein kinase